MKNDFVLAISQLSAEKNLDPTKVFEAVEAAMASAFKKDELLYAEVEVKIDIDSGDIDVWRLWEVRDDEAIEDDELQVNPERASEMGWPGQEPGAMLREPLEASMDAGRIAAQTAKQVVLQRLREAEREAVYGEFTNKQGELVPVAEPLLELPRADPIRHGSRVQVGDLSERREREPGAIRRVEVASLVQLLQATPIHVEVQHGLVASNVDGVQVVREHRHPGPAAHAHLTDLLDTPVVRSLVEAVGLLPAHADDDRPGRVVVGWLSTTTPPETLA